MSSLLCNGLTFLKHDIKSIEKEKNGNLDIFKLKNSDQI